MINHLTHITLLQKELLYIQAKWDLILQKTAASMLKNGSLYVSKFAGYDSARGNILVKFNNKICLPPRKNENLVGFVPSIEKQNFQKWNSLTYEGLYIEGRYLSFDTKSIYYKNEGEYTTVGFSGISEEDVSKLQKDILIYFGPPEEPIEYIANLLSFLKETKPNIDEILNLKIGTQNWNPQPLIVDESIVTQIQTDLIEKEIIIIQGPPGTGKTFLMAQLCSALLKTGNRILVTALTNRALIELAKKEHLKTALSEGKIYKSALTVDESKNKKVKGIKAFKSLRQQQPQMLLSTYYIMSQIAAKAMEDAHFDYIIIEEASQAFLSTIALARKLGKKCIIIGDIKQLEPIFHKLYSVEDPNNFHWMICGLKAICFFLPSSKQYILTDSYRLTQNSVDATNSFYSGQLKSKSNAELPLNFSNFPLLDISFQNRGGTTLKKFQLPDGKIPSKECAQFIVDIVNQLNQFIKIHLIKNNDDDATEIAVLTYNRDSVRFLQNEIASKCSDSENVLVETIDRIQGLTTDFTIFFIPIDAMAKIFSSPNHFNVATSRAKLCTLIIADKTIVHFENNSPDISNYFKQIKQIDT